MKPPRLALILLAVLTLLLGAVFVPHFRGDWIWDDVLLVQHNPNLSGWGGLRVLLTSDLLAGTIAARVDLYRPVPMAVTWTVVQLAGKSIVALRSASLVLHAASTILLACWLLRLRIRRSIAFGAAFVFAVHPLVSETVMWIVAKDDLLGTGFCLAALCVWPLPADRRVAARVLVASIATALAMLSKESYFVFPAVLGAYHLLSWRRPSARSNALLLLGPVAALGAVAVLRHALGIGTMGSAWARPVGAQLQDYATVLAHYTWHVLTFQRAPLVLTYRPLPPWPSVAVLAGVAAITALLFMHARRRSDRNWWALFGWGWFLVAFAPSALALSLSGIWGNRYAYFPMMGMATCLAVIADSAAEQTGTRARRLLLWILPAGVLVEALFTASDAVCWRDEITRFGVDLAEAPDDPQTLIRYGAALSKRDGCEAGMPYFEASTKADATIGESWHAMAGCLVSKGLYAEARHPARQAVRLEPGNAHAAWLSAVAELEAGNRQEAISLLRYALSVSPENSSARELLDRLLAEQRPPTSESPR